ncbi:cytochrome c [Bacillus sp. HMF5848]|uniref:cytochrome c550 n=1 Tax=Bacillus sp. HMF5848 TaxID=2495421 RepID=UPI000F795025|nr:cytochrome c [Bacillus sp. HMF5848]RSK27874.1 cytochrome c [Bacillus sp. HMF5848]
MNRNPLLGFGLIMVLGVILMVVVSFVGNSNYKELALEAEGGKATEEQAGDTEAASPDAIYAKSCIGCHGQNLEGGVGPKLDDIGSRLTAEQIQDVIINGQGTMPGNLVGPAEAEALANWLAEKK